MNPQTFSHGFTRTGEYRFGSGAVGIKTDITNFGIYFMSRAAIETPPLIGSDGESAFFCWLCTDLGLIFQTFRALLFFAKRKTEALF